MLPVERRLKDIKEMKSRLAEKWIMDNMDPAKYKLSQQNLDKEETRLMAVRQPSDADQLTELALTRSYLAFWQKQLNDLSWNREDETTEDRLMIRSVDEPHQNVLEHLGKNDIRLSELMQFPASRRELFDKLQLRLVVFQDRMEVKALLSIPDIHNQECTSMRGLG